MKSRTTLGKNFGCGTLPLASLGSRGGRRRPPLHILSVFFYARVMACVAVGLFSWFLQPFFDGVFTEFHL